MTRAVHNDSHSSPTRHLSLWLLLSRGAKVSVSVLRLCEVQGGGKKKNKAGQPRGHVSSMWLTTVISFRSVHLSPTAPRSLVTLGLPSPWPLTSNSSQVLATRACDTLLYTLRRQLLKLKGPQNILEKNALTSKHPQVFRLPGRKKWEQLMLGNSFHLSWGIMRGTALKTNSIPAYFLYHCQGN